MAVQLPPGWVITKTLETLANPNTGQPFFSRWTWICTDEAGSYTCASGSQEDCEAQAQSMAQARVQRWPYYEAS